MSKYGLPVLMYHHINNHVTDLVTISPKGFENQMAWLANKGYNTLDTQEALTYLTGKKPLTGKEVLITFDDGVLDNWVYAYPILKKYGLRAIIFLATDFVEVEGVPRHHMGQVWQGEVTAKELPKIRQHKDFDYQAVTTNKNFGIYLRWSELAQMESDGVIDIQAHSHLHASYFCSDKIVGFSSNPRDRLAMATGGDSRLGIPIYEKTSSLVGRRYYDDPRLRNYMADYVEKHGGAELFKRPKEERKKELLSVVKDYINGHGLTGHYESAEECRQRIKNDLLVCKQLIEKNLSKKCTTIAWPWGVYDEQLIQQAQEVGYQAAFTTNRGSNVPDCDLMRLNRCIIKKDDISWFAQQLFIYSRPKVSQFYLKHIRRKI